MGSISLAPGATASIVSHLTQPGQLCQHLVRPMANVGLHRRAVAHYTSSLFSGFIRRFTMAYAATAATTNRTRR
jgi:hypothetical protein